MAKTAWMIHDDIPGFNPRGCGLTRCYQLSEPADFDGDGIAHEYVLVRVRFAFRDISASVSVFPATATGACAERTLNARIGSYRLRGNPNGRADYIEGCFAMALGFNGFTIVDPPPPEPEPQPEPEPPTEGS